MARGGEASFRIGGQFDKYEILAILGRGGMATVYRALDISLNREVALKVLPSDVSAQLLARFQTEIEVLSRLRHPHVVHVFETGNLGGRFYYAMQLYEGPDLEGLLESRSARHPRLDEEELRLLALGLSHALEHSHGNGVLHRDLKPANVMLAEGFHPILMDFGLARPKESKLTAENATAGTLHYMAPEQIEGGELSPATDFYQLGLLLFECITGQLPFAEGGQVGLAPIMARCQEMAPPPSLFVPQTPGWLDSMVHACLQRRPCDRPSAARLLVEALETRTPLRRPCPFEAPSPVPEAPVSAPSDPAQPIDLPVSQAARDAPPPRDPPAPSKHAKLAGPSRKGRSDARKKERTTEARKTSGTSPSPGSARRKLLLLGLSFAVTAMGSWMAWTYFTTQGLLLRGRTALRQGDARKALGLFRQALRGRWLTDRAFLAALEASGDTGQLEETLGLLRDHAEAFRRLGRGAGMALELNERLRMRGAHAESLRLTALLTELHPSHPGLAEARACELHRIGDWDQALKVLDRVRWGRSGPTSRHQANRGCLLLLLGRNHQAREPLEASLEPGRDRTLALANLALLAFVDGRPVEGRRRLMEAVTKGHEGNWTEDFGALLLGRDELRIRKGPARPRLPVQTLAEFWSSLGRMLLDGKQPRDALACLECARSVGGENEELLELFLRLHLEARDLRSAFPHAERLLALHPDDLPLRKRICSLLEKSGASDLADRLRR